MLLLALLLALFAKSLDRQPHDGGGAGRGRPDADRPRLHARRGSSGGGDFASSSPRGKVVVLNFWASWCDPCKDEAPVLQRDRTQYDGRASRCSGVDSQDVDRDAARLRQPLRPHLSAAARRRQRVYHRWGLTGLPETFLIDREGRVVHHFPGEVDAARRARLQLDAADREPSREACRLTLAAGRRRWPSRRRAGAGGRPTGRWPASSTSSCARSAISCSTSRSRPSPTASASRSSGGMTRAGRKQQVHGPAGQPVRRGGAGRAAQGMASTCWPGWCRRRCCWAARRWPLALAMAWARGRGRPPPPAAPGTPTRRWTRASTPTSRGRSRERRRASPSAPAGLVRHALRAAAGARLPVGDRHPPGRHAGQLAGRRRCRSCSDSRLVFVVHGRAGGRWPAASWPTTASSWPSCRGS